MRIKFCVSPQEIVEFAEVLTDNNLSSEISGTSEDGNLYIEVQLGRGDQEIIQELEELSVSEED